MPEILDIPESGASQQEVMEMLKKNFGTLTKQGLKAGSFLLYDSIVATAQAVTSTTGIDLAQFKGAVNTSGGLVLLQGQVYCSTTANTIYVSLKVDDVEVAIFTLSGTVGAMVNVCKYINMNAGNHTWKLTARVGGGTVTVGDTVAKSTFQIVEHLRG